MSDILLDLLKTFGDSDVVISDDSGNKYNLNEILSLRESANLLDNSSPNNFNAKILYKIILYTVDFTLDTVRGTISNAVDNKKLKPFKDIPASIAGPILSMNGGAHALRLVRFVETTLKKAMS